MYGVNKAGHTEKIAGLHGTKVSLGTELTDITHKRRLQGI